MTSQAMKDAFPLRTHSYVHSLLTHDEIAKVLTHIEDMSYITEKQLMSKLYDKVKNKDINKTEFHILCTFFFDSWYNT